MPLPRAPNDCTTCPATVTSLFWKTPGSLLIFAMVVRCGQAVRKTSDSKMAKIVQGLHFIIVLDTGVSGWMRMPGTALHVLDSSGSGAVPCAARDLSHPFSIRGSV